MWSSCRLCTEYIHLPLIVRQCCASRCLGWQLLLYQDHKWSLPTPTVSHPDFWELMFCMIGPVIMPHQVTTDLIHRIANDRGHLMAGNDCELIELLDAAKDIQVTPVRCSLNADSLLSPLFSCPRTNTECHIRRTMQSANNCSIATQTPKRQAKHSLAWFTLVSWSLLVCMPLNSGIEGGQLDVPDGNGGRFHILLPPEGCVVLMEAHAVHAGSFVSCHTM
jgi:hypothetical protein